MSDSVSSKSRLSVILHPWHSLSSPLSILHLLLILHFPPLLIPHYLLNTLCVRVLPLFPLIEEFFPTYKCIAHAFTPFRCLIKCHPISKPSLILLTWFKIASPPGGSFYSLFSIAFTTNILRITFNLSSRMLHSYRQEFLPSLYTDLSLLPKHMVSLHPRLLGKLYCYYCSVSDNQDESGGIFHITTSIQFRSLFSLVILRGICLT